MFITVRFGDGEESIFNPNCRTNILLEDIKRRCNCTKDVTVDLSDESGNLKYLANHPMSYATEILKERESFVLIRVEKKGETEGDSYTPMLNDLIIVTPEFLERLSRCESDSLNAKNSVARPVRINSPLTRKQTGLQGKTKGSLMSSTGRNKTSREKTPGQKRNKESR
ncbi:hypothetical protein OS493_010339 [Desmophyllum pertusum]|uniref:Uncharacterized protein n=1 Tax=Desmophyllum pertusum TaxID=174260 RepID=A0A9X0A3D2_9CNID|nr:hypothetical protein OS493_010339 [Desmophyllum pertusum]